MGIRIFPRGGGAWAIARSPWVTRGWKRPNADGRVRKTSDRFGHVADFCNRSLWSRLVKATARKLTQTMAKRDDGLGCECW
jgi:hypothetical protein